MDLFKLFPVVFNVLNNISKVASGASVDTISLKTALYTDSPNLPSSFLTGSGSVEEMTTLAETAEIQSPVLHHVTTSHLLPASLSYAGLVAVCKWPDPAKSTC